jgi:hypothetical protein
MGVLRDRRAVEASGFGEEVAKRLDRRTSLRRRSLSADQRATGRRAASTHAASFDGLLGCADGAAPVGPFRVRDFACVSAKFSASRAGASLVLVGDHRQLAAVGPGGALAALLERRPDLVITLDTNVRRTRGPERSAGRGIGLGL